MVLMFDGVNNAGKSSIINILKNDSNLFTEEPLIQHYGAPVGDTMLEQLKDETESYFHFFNLIELNHNVICDRTPFGGTFFFGPKFRNYTDYNLSVFKTILYNWARDKKSCCQYFILQKPLELLERDYDGKDISFEQIKEDKHYYDVVLPEILDSCNIKYTLFNVENRSAEENAELIKKLIE